MANFAQFIRKVYEEEYVKPSRMTIFGHHAMSCGLFFVILQPIRIYNGKGTVTTKRAAAHKPEGTATIYGGHL
jgi:hypothetical protein